MAFELLCAGLRLRAAGVDSCDWDTPGCRCTGRRPLSVRCSTPALAACQPNYSPPAVGTPRRSRPQLSTPAARSLTLDVAGGAPRVAQCRARARMQPSASTRMLRPRLSRPGAFVRRRTHQPGPDLKEPRKSSALISLVCSIAGPRESRRGFQIRKPRLRRRLQSIRRRAPRCPARGWANERSAAAEFSAGSTARERPQPLSVR